MLKLALRRRAADAEVIDMRLPETFRRSLSRTSLVLSVAGLAMVTASITALATLDSSSPTSSGKRTMILSEDEVAAGDEEASPLSTTTTTTGAAPAEVAASTVTTGRDDAQDVRLDEYEERIVELETAPTTTTTATTVAAPPVTVTTTGQQPVSDVTTTTATTVPRTRDTTTTTAPPTGHWVELTRFEGPVGGAPREIYPTTGYVRCVRHRSDGEADPEIVQRPMLMDGMWDDVCTSWGPSGTKSPVVRLLGRNALRIINTTVGDGWIFGTIVEEYRCLVPNCTMPTVGSNS